MIEINNERLFTKEEIVKSIPQKDVKEFLEGWDDLLAAGYIEKVAQIGKIVFYRLLNEPRKRGDK